MLERVIAVGQYVWEILHPDFGLAWNLFLALIPFVLSALLFRRSRRRDGVWWWVAVIFVLFLPNAAYVLTDVIHLIAEIRAEPPLPVWAITLVLIPQYSLFILVGFQAHVLSLINLGYYLQRIQWNRWLLPAELLLNLLCAIGIYLGRFRRFNSWDVATQPEQLFYTTLDDLTGKLPLLAIGVTFVVITALYYLFKVLDLAVLEAWQRRRSNQTRLRDPHRPSG